MPTPEEALQELCSMPDAELAQTSEFPRYFVGAHDEVRDQLIDMASVLHLDEVMVVTIVHSHHARMRSYELLAKAFDLKARA